jgi:carboxypeptidase Q
VQYRVSGAWRAAKYGAVAALVSSVTPDSVESVHAGGQHYSQDPSIPKIPVAAITTEDAKMLRRMQDRGDFITLQLKLNNTSIPNTYSNNLIFEIRGN